MSKNITEDIMIEICKRRGIKLGEKFKIKSNNNIIENTAEFYRIDENGLEFYAMDDWHATSGIIEKILTGEVEIIRLPFAPKLGEEYYTITEFETVKQIVWKAHVSDLQNYAFGNCFRTQSEAETASKEIYSWLENIYADERPLRKEK